MANDWGLEPGTVIGKAPCFDCGAKVEVKITRGKKPGYHCKGRLEGKACDGDHYYGFRVADRMVEKYRASQAKPASQDPDPKPVADPDPEPDQVEKAADDDWL